MILSMKQIQLLIQFFHSKSQSQFKGIKNLLDKIEYYNENDRILEETLLDFQDEEKATSTPIKYYLMIKPPSVKEIKIESDQ